MGAGRARLIGCAAAAVLLAGTEGSAHRRDELLQAARVDVEPASIAIELDLTPGIAVADGLVAAIDRDRDGAITENEGQAYAARVISALSLTVDGRPVALTLAEASIPSIDEMRAGVGAIRLRARAAGTSATAGSHQLRFANAHETGHAAFLANALVPLSPLVSVTAQHRTDDQSELTIDYAIAPPPGTPVTRLLVLALVALAVAVPIGRGFGARRALSRS